MKKNEITIQEIQKIQKRLFYAGETLRKLLGNSPDKLTEDIKEVWAVILTVHTDELAEIIRMIKFGGDDAEEEKETGEVG